MSDPVYDTVTFLAAERFAVANAAGDSFLAEFVPGLRIRADCQADGLRLGTVTAAVHEAGRTEVTVTMDAGAALTANLSGVLHGNDVPDSLCDHAALHAAGGRDALTPAALGAATAGHSHDSSYAPVGHNHAGTYAPAAQGVTNGDGHDHSGGDGGQIAHTALSGIGTNTHAQIDTHIGNTANPHGVTAAQAGAIPATTGAATAYVGAASESAAGKVQLANATEAQAGTDTAKAMTAAGVVAAIAAATGIDAPDIVRILNLGTAAFIDLTFLHASATWDAGSCVNAAQISTTVSVPGATIDDFVQASCSISLAGLNLRAVVTAANVVTLYLSNLTGAAVDLASATYYVRVTKRLAVR